jgi:hypothetical protein
MRRPVPADVRPFVKRFRDAKRRTEAARVLAREALELALGGLVGEYRLSYRDAAEVLGISHQRVQQVAAKLGLRRR